MSVALEAPPGSCVQRPPQPLTQGAPREATGAVLGHGLVQSCGAPAPKANKCPSERMFRPDHARVGNLIARGDHPIIHLAEATTWKLISRAQSFHGSNFFDKRLPVEEGDLYEEGGAKDKCTFP